jgi:alkanesulfonate monooxygenase SsuD/methylene tetrahydromethanopterin reductase-like flavin-dependent oxidoreductase (luciferase family)
MSENFILSAHTADARMNRPDWARALLAAGEAAGIDLLLLGRAGMVPFDAIVIAAWAAPLVQRMGLVATVTTGLGHPFHAARALSAIDFLSGAKAGWCPLATNGHPPQQAADMASAARALWDGWGADTMIIDKASGRYLDAASVRVPDYRGPFYQVRGPVNAARPPQGHPVLVADDAAPFDLAGVDIALARDPAQAPRAAKVLLKVDDAAGLARAEALRHEGAIAGVHLTSDDSEAMLALAREAAARFAPHRAQPAGGGGASLRTRLGLPPAPSAALQGEAA